MSIKSVKITNLYGNNYEWHLNPDVNILMGVNGTYKSTILQLIKSKLVDKKNYPDITLEQKPQSYFLITRTNWDVYGLYNVRDNKEFKSFVDKITNTTYISDSYYGVAKRSLSIGEFRLIDLLALAPLNNNNNKQLILLLDNPENNLHIDWQRNLISWIRELNPDCQIIMTTHSPTICYQGWIDKVTKIENIKVN